MENLQLLVEEWKILRGEITERSKIVSQYVQQMSLISGGLLAYAINIDNLPAAYAMIIAANAVACLGGSLLTSNRRQIWRIATYLRIFIEPKLPSVKWETRVSAASMPECGQPLDKINPSKAKISSHAVIVDAKIIAAMHFACGFVIIVIMLTRAEDAIHMTISALVIAASIALGMMRMRRGFELQRGGVVEQEFERSWARVLINEQIQSDRKVHLEK